MFVETTTLPPEMAKRAADFFGTSFHETRLHHHELPQRLGMHAFARGRHIHLSPTLRDWRNPQHLAILGHELAHQVQQRQGRAARAGGGVLIQPDLEVEADEAGRSFAYGGPCPPALLNASAASPATATILQPLVKVGPKQLESVTDLCPKIQTALNMIESGQAWLSWAIADGNVYYTFNNEEEVPGGVQMGLHGSPLLLLKKLGLLVNPLRLTAVDDTDFEIIAHYELGTVTGGAVRRRARKAVRNAGLMDQDALAAGSELVTDAPLFQALGLQDRLLLAQLYEEFSELGYPIEPARDFALEVAQSIPELGDYMYFYRLYLSQTDQRSDDDCQSDALQFLQRLQGELYGTLRGAAISPPPASVDVQSFLQKWTAQGYHLGFPRISRAAVQILFGCDFEALNSHMHQQVTEYLKAAGNFFCNNAAAEPSMSQSGTYLTYPVTGSLAYGTLTWNVAGTLTIGEFNPYGPEPIAALMAREMAEAKVSANQKTPAAETDDAPDSENPPAAEAAAPEAKNPPGEDAAEPEAAKSGSRRRARTTKSRTTRKKNESP